MRVLDAASIPFFIFLLLVWIGEAGRVVQLDVGRIDFRPPALQFVQLSAVKEVVSNLDTVVQELCEEVTYVNYDECIFCMALNIENALIDESRSEVFRGVIFNATDVHIFKDRAVRLLSRGYRQLEADSSVQRVCIIGSFQEQIFRLIARFGEKKSLRYFLIIPANESAVSTLTAMEGIVAEFSVQLDVVVLRDFASFFHHNESIFCDAVHFRHNTHSPVFVSTTQEAFLTHWLERIQPFSVDRKEVTIIFETEMDNVSLHRPATSHFSPRQLVWDVAGTSKDGFVQFARRYITKQGLRSSCGIQLEAGGDVFFLRSFSIFFGRFVPDLSNLPPVPPPPLALSDYDLWKKEVRILLCFNAVIFVETARGLREALRSLGFRHIFILGLPSYASLLAHLRDASPGLVLQIIIGAHSRETLVIADYVLWHTENHWSTYIAQSLTYRAYLGSARGLLTYSPAHVNFLEQITRPEDQVPIAIVPFYTQPLYYASHVDAAEDELVSHSIAQGLPPWMLPSVSLHTSQEGELLDVSEGAMGVISRLRKLYDISMLSTPTQHRLNFAQSLLKHFLAQQQPTPSLSSSFLFDRTNGWPQEDLLLGILEMGDMGDVYIRETLSVLSAVAVNVHQSGAGSVLETHRINSLLALGKAVVSETTDYLFEGCFLLDAAYEQAEVVSFISANNWTGLAQETQRLLHDHTARHRLERRGLRFYHEEIQQNSSALDGLLRAVHSKIAAAYK